MANDKRQDQPGPRPGSQHVADEPAADDNAPGATVQKPVTETGLPVEEQVRKEWDTNRDGGLPTPLRDAAR